MRDLADKADVALGSLSRTIDLLDREGLIERVDRGPITEVDWQQVIRRWAKNYEIATSNQVTTYLDPRGLPALAEKLGKLKRAKRRPDRSQRNASLPSLRRDSLPYT